jgi:hypothetical protein
MQDSDLNNNEVINILTRLDKSLIEKLELNKENKKLGPLWSSLIFLSKTKKPKKFLEIGCQSGISSSMVALSSINTELFLFDFPNGGSGGFEGSQYFLEKHMESFAKNRYQITYGESQKNKDVIIENGPYDLINIDGDHSYEGAKADWEIVKKCISKNSIVLLDDITNQHHTYLLDLFNEMLNENLHSDFYINKNETGVGVLFIKE